MKPVRCEDLRDGLPVNALNGALILSGEEDLDFVVRGVISLTWQRTYCATSARVGWMGRGWSSPLEAMLDLVPDASGQFTEFIDFVGVTGRRVRFKAMAPGAHEEAPADQMRLARDESGAYRLSTVDGLSYLFAEARGDQLHLTGVADRNGNEMHLRHGRRSDGGEAIEVACPGGRRVVLQMQAQRLVQVDAWWPGASSPTVLARYGYDGGGRLTEVVNRAGQCTRRFRYGAHGMLVWQSHADVFESWAEYADAGADARVVAYRDNVGRAWTLDYADTHTAVTDAQGRRSLYHLDAKRRWTGYTDPLGRFAARGLDQHGRLRMVSDPAEHVVEMRYDERGNPVEVQDAEGGVTAIEWHPAFKLPVAITDAMAHTTRLDYDERGNLVTETGPTGVSTAYEYGDKGLVSAVIDGKGGRTELVYDEHGQLVSHTDCAGRRMRLAYDPEGKLIAVENAVGARTVYDYDVAGRLARQAQADGSFEQYEWNAAGQMVAVQDHLGRRTTYGYAPDGQLVQRCDAQGQALHYEYDPARRLAALRNENGARYRFAYDDVDQLIDELRFDGTRARFAYDDAGFLVRSIEAPGTPEAIDTLYERDAVGRLLTRRTAHTTVRFKYDKLGHIVAARSDPDDTLVRLTYDEAYRVTEETLSIGATSHRTTYSYDELGHRESTTLPDGRVIGRLSYGNGHVHQVHLDGMVLSDIEHDALYREVSRTQGRLLTTRAYDPVGRLTSLATRGVSQDVPSMLSARQFRYDEAGRLVQAQSPVRTQQWAYDSLDRLTRYDDARFAFDPAHNLLDKGVDAQAASARIEDNRIKVFEDKRYAYDAHGRVVDKRVGGHTAMRFEWDGEHRLAKAVVMRGGQAHDARYAYDAFGRRVAKIVDGAVTRFVWEGDQLLQAIDAQGVSTFVYEPTSHVPMVLLRQAQGDGPARPPGVYHYHCDPAGRPVALTDEAGQLAWQGEFGAWGRCTEANALPSVTQPLRFQGQYEDEETGWHYNRFRYYDPDIGRFTTPDPMGLKGGINPYAYAPNPMGWIDPLGLVKSPVQCAADKALKDGKESGAACQLEVGNEPVLTDVSGNPGKLHPKLRRLLGAVAQKLLAQGIEVPAWHGSCAEVGCLNQAFKRGLDPTGGKSTAVNIGSKLKGQKHGAPKKACPSCKVLLEELDITDGSA
ncbi:MAG: RHS repeat-associated core domain-containing protein [Aquabacterium sp.]